jgi:hypothetical protein
MSLKKALLIGCNYINTSNQLSGCINDIIHMRNMLIDAYAYTPDSIIMLRDDVPTILPTRANILNCLKLIIGQSASLSEIVIHYSGHGTSIRDMDGDEVSGQDQAIVPLDFNRNGFITDDELFNIIKDAKCRVLMFFDSCHSGTVCDLQYSINYINGKFSRSTNNAKRIVNPNVIMMSGCRDDQTSADSYSNLEDLAVGAFTNSLLETLRASNHNVDMLRLYNDVCYNLSKSGFTQIPILSCSSYMPAYIFMRGGTNQSNGSTLITPEAAKLKAQPVLPPPTPKPTPIKPVSSPSPAKKGFTMGFTISKPIQEVSPAVYIPVNNHSIKSISSLASNQKMKIVFL